MYDPSRTFSNRSDGEKIRGIELSISPKTLVFGTGANILDLRCQKPCSKLKPLLKVFDPHLIADINCVAENR
jgi:hypothetical protein